MITIAPEVAVAEITRLMATGVSPREALQAVVDKRLHAGGAAYVAIVLRSTDEYSVVVDSADQVGPVARVDTHRLRSALVTVANPARHSATSGSTATIDDAHDTTHTPGKWREFASVLVESGCRSVRAFPIKMFDLPVGALAIHTAGASTGPSASVFGQTLADLVAIAMTTEPGGDPESRADTAVRSMASDSAQVEQAVGMLAELDGTDAATARSRLYTTAARENLGPTEYARRLVLGYLPDVDCL